MSTHELVNPEDAGGNLLHMRDNSSRQAIPSGSEASCMLGLGGAGALIPGVLTSAPVMGPFL